MKNTAKKKALFIMIVYLLFGCTWIIMSDTIVDALVTSKTILVFFSMTKGLIYVSLTALLIYFLTFTSFSKLISTQKSLLEIQRQKSIILENVPGMIYTSNLSLQMQYVSKGCEELTGYEAEHLLKNDNLSYCDLIKNCKIEILEKRKDLIAQRKKYTDEYEIITADGTSKWVWEHGEGVYDDNGKLTALEGLIIDVTKRKEQEFKLTYLQEHNKITGLHNRYKFEEFMKIFDENKAALLLLNLKKLNLLNLTHGYIYTDKLINEVAKKLKSIFPETCKLFHIAFDSFALVVNNYQTCDDLIEIGNKIIIIINDVINTKNINCCIGIVEINARNIDNNEILKYALIAAEYENPTSIFKVNIFNKEMEESIRRLEVLKDELSDCVKNEYDPRFSVIYQPIVDSFNGNIHAFEALARFNSNEYGSISPIEFISIAEQTQLIVQLGKKILNAAFEFQKYLSIHGKGNIVISVNVSAIQILREDFLDDLTFLIKKHGIQPYNICIEITESYFAENLNDLNEKFQVIRQLGFSIALDDFGIGYSTFARESELSIDCLKIDKSFVSKILDVGEKEIIISDIISMAHKLGHYVIAEGIEDKKQFQYLLENKCDYMQGYLFGKPATVDEVLFCLLKEGKEAG